MIYRTYRPGAPLTGFVGWFWFFEGFVPNYRKERVLPDGGMELVIYLKEGPRRLFDRENGDEFQSFRGAWISGAQSRFIEIDTAQHSSMMGVHFLPGGARPFLNLPLGELRDRVVEVDCLWGQDGLRERLLEAADMAEKFEILEVFLLRQGRDRFEHRPVVEGALSVFSREDSFTTVRSMAERLGVSQRHLIQEFTNAVGLTPKRFSRISRFQRVLKRIEASKKVEWADVSAACGYYDQSHFAHDFSEFSGFNPSAYLTERGEYLNFVPIRNPAS
jgi:AraC-like DNA-binding protein